MPPPIPIDKRNVAYYIRGMKNMVTRAELAKAAGWDAGQVSADKAGRKAWSRADYNAAVAEYNRIHPCPEAK